MYKYQKYKKYIYVKEYRAFKKELIKYLKIVNRRDLQLKQKDIKKYYDSVKFTKPNVIDCCNKLVELYPTIKVYNYNHKYQTSSHFE